MVIDSHWICWLERAEVRDILEHQPELQRGSQSEPMGNIRCCKAGGQQHGVLLLLQLTVQSC